MNYLITGASRGIGYDTALAIVKNSDHQVLAVSRNKEGLETLSEKAKNEQERDCIHTMVFDVAKGDFEQLKLWVASFGYLNGIVNNAGVLINKPFEKLSVQDWSQTFAVNLFGTVNVIQHLLPLLQNAHIVNIGSMGGFQGSSKFPGLTAYSSSKAALANLTECLAEEFKEKNIAVNCLALGAVQTKMLASVFPGYKAPVESEQMGEWLSSFLQTGHQFFNGKTLPVSVSTP